MLKSFNKFFVLILVSAVISSALPINSGAKAASYNLIEAVDQGKKILEGAKLSYITTPQYKTVTTGSKKKKKTTKVISGYTLTQKDIALAILDPATNQVQVTFGKQKGESITFSDPKFKIKQGTFNGVNTPFAVSRPSGGIVVALKYLFTPVENGDAKTIANAKYDGVYVPYSSALNDSGLAAKGEKYLDSVINNASAQLSGINSASNPGIAVSKAIKPEVVKALLYAEHMDSKEFSMAKDVSEMTRKVNLLLGGNGPDTYKYSVSSANARGISQFIPSTYSSLVTRHPEAGLTKDYVAGMTDHVNAVKATFLLLDDYSASVASRSSGMYNPTAAYEYAVASYNGGVTRIARAINNYGPNWDTDHQAELADIKARISSQQAVINDLTFRLKSASPNDKSALNLALGDSKAQLSILQDQQKKVEDSTLRGETLFYVYKIRQLLPQLTVEA